MLGFIIRNRRIDKRMTIADLSNKAKVSTVSIIKYENDKAIPGIKTTEKLAKALGWSYAEFRKIIVENTDPRNYIVSE